MAAERVRPVAALQRFGLGPRVQDTFDVRWDPAGILLADLSAPDAAELSDPGLPSAGEAGRMVAREAAARRAAAQSRKNPPADDAAMQSGSGAAKLSVAQSIYRAEAEARLRKALASEIGFVERLVWFWSNHFCVSTAKTAVVSIAGAFEREAIRPHVLGRFSDMLLTVAMHPAMLIYLDNAVSVGPKSPWGMRRGRGINENLAREILELHTLGVRGGYSQQDVTSFATMLTGWSVVPRAQERGGEFLFQPNMHEPGIRNLLGKAYKQEGWEQGRAALLDLARHPATARHVSTKFARHFVGDPPPPALVDRLKNRFLDTDGDLRAMATALVEAPEAWNSFGTKIRRPMEWIVACHRLTGTRPAQIAPVLRHLAMLGEPLWRPPAPDGFPDDNRTWISALRRRIDVARTIAAQSDEQVDPRGFVDGVLAHFVSAETRLQVRRAETRVQGLTLLLMAPELLRR